MILALCAMTIVANAATNNYLCAITDMQVDTLKNNTKNQFTLRWTQKCKNTREYSSNPEGTYTTTVKLVLNSDDRTLEGTYTTEGSSTLNDASNPNQNLIGLVTSELYYGSTRRLLRDDSISTFTIMKIDDTHYGISVGRLCFTAAALQDRGKNTWVYNYCYAEDEILVQGISPKPYVFGYDGEYHEEVYNYDMTVNGISVIRDDSEYDAKRYFLTLSCTGKNRDTNVERNYEVQLAIYPQSESIIGTFSTRGQGVYMYAPNSYVKDLKIGKQRNLNNDSTSVIQIKSAAGDKQYSFYGGTLICTDMDANYSAVYGKKRIEAVHYYHFSDEAIPFSYDESQTIFNLTPSKVTVEEETDGFELTVKASDGSANYTIYLDILSEQLEGSYTISGSTLGEWSKVERGSSSSYLASGSNITITSKGNYTYTLSGTLIGENGNTYTISAFDFQYGNSGGSGSGEGGEGGSTTTNTYNVTADTVKIQDLSTDKYNYFVTVNAHTSTGEYEIAFDVWPLANSTVGSFNASDKTIGYVSSFVHKTKANGSAVNMWYYPEKDSPISLTIVSNGDGTCTLSGSITAVRNNVAYTYVIAPYTWNYSAEEVDPDPEQDPYRFEPIVATTINFVGDVVSFRDRDTYIEVTLNEMANETYDWIELRLMSDTMDMPAGNYIINDSYAAGPLTASKGYIGGNDDPSYVAIRADKENWGQYTPYYLASGTINVSFNEKGDTIFVTGTALSHNGTTVNINVKSYNMLYVDETPKEPEFVTLQIDTAYVTYRSDLSDSINNQFVYAFDFNYGEDYPEVIATVVMSKPMEYVAGTYSLADGSLSGRLLAQDQEDYEMYIYGVPAYDFTVATLTITPADNGQWTFTMHLEDAISSTYDFTLTQNPEIALYPQPTVDPAEQPYTDEMKEKASITIVLDTLVWNAKTVDKDGVIDIYLTQLEADINGLRAYIQLGMFADVAYPAAGTYPVNGTGENGTFNASYGRFESTLFPCYVTLMDGDGYAHAVWYLMSGDITLSYENGQPVLSGVCTSYYGSTITFTYKPKATDFEEVESENAARSKKILHKGLIYILRGDKKYSIMGQELR